MTRSTRRGIAVAASLVLIATGCDRSTSPVGQITGTVRYQGRDLKSDEETTWNVIFVTTDAGTRFPTTIGRSGTYVLNGIPLGPVKIAILGTPRIPAALGPKSPPNPNSEHEMLRRRLSDRYSDPRKSHLEYTVIQGPQIHPIDLTD